MAENIVIVESPAKAGTIEKYLGKDYQVIASMGHVRDLPSSKLGVDVDDGFTPQYVIPPKARTTIKKLKDALKGKKTVYLATDLDREGEAIAWHIAEVLELAKAKGVVVKRITFDEITKPAILEAISKPRDIYANMVDAQQSRRVLDRLVGYTLSPVLWRKVYKGLSAGRVQSAALRLVVDREREREAFKEVEYWSLKALLATKKQEEFEASLTHFNGVKLEAQSITTEQEVKDMEKAVATVPYVVDSLESKTLKRRPYAPYTTSTMQQDAVNKLGTSAKNVMRMAQKLYEAGHITYMRTDSVDLAQSAQEAIRAYLKTEYGAHTIPEKAPKYTSKKQAQEAHEAIRPTDPTRLSTSIKADPQAQRLYDLIRRRALASQMKEALLEQSAIVISAGPGMFRATGQRVLEPGFLAVYKDDQEENNLPLLQKGDALTLKELKSEQHFTEPPPRYSEATLIKTLEELGIGRPSTYAPTIDTLEARKYVLIEQRRLVPEDVGKVVTDLLKEHFPDIVDLNFTAGMEEKLDKVADGTVTYKDLLTEFWAPFKSNVDVKTESIERVDMTKETNIPCPNCGTLMIEKRGRFGPFLACPKFPECKTTLPLNGKPDSGLICPICGLPLKERKAKRGMFFGCSGYPKCTFAVWKREQLPTKIEELEKAGEKLSFKAESLASLTTEDGRQAA